MLAAASMDIIGEFFRTTVALDSLGTLDGAISASAATITLSVGFSSLDLGAQVVKIDSELIMVMQSGGTLTVGGNGRGYFGSTAASHLDSAAVSVANLSAMIGNNAWEWDADDDSISSDSPWKNATPGVVFAGVGGDNENVHSGGVRHSIRKPRIQIKSFGGKDFQNNHTPLAADIIDRAVLERIEEISAATTFASGKLMSIFSDTDSQRADDPDARPRWPMYLRFANAEIQ